MSKLRLINSVDLCVKDALTGLAYQNNDVSIISGKSILIKKDISQNKVALISGGGSGHEPAHAGFIGKGMLSAVVCGNIFSSPSVGDIFQTICQVYNAQHEVDHSNTKTPGIIIFVKNYTGDRINFTCAAQKAEAYGYGPIRLIIVDDDCSFKDTILNMGRRGLAGTLMVYKIAGAMAMEGHDIETIYNMINGNLLGNSKSKRVRSISTIGMAVASCTRPGQKVDNDTTFEGYEYGIGIHGERGVCRNPMEPIKIIVAKMLEQLLESIELTTCGCQMDSSISDVAIMVNNLGAISVLELNIIVKEVVDFFKPFEEYFALRRIYSGTFLTSLDMGGFSLTLLHLTNPRWLSYLDQVTGAVSWPKSYVFDPLIICQSQIVDQLSANELKHKSHLIQTIENNVDLSKATVDWISKNFICGCESLLENVDYLNELDLICGDGDCGTSHGLAAQELISVLNSQKWENICDFLETVASTLENCMQGTSGALWTLFFQTIFTSTKKFKPNKSEDFYIMQLAKSCLLGAEQIKSTGLAKLGDKTLLDVLVPTILFWIKSLESQTNSGNILTNIQSNADICLESTKKMQFKAGRGSYMPNTEDTLDPGCVALHLFIKSFKNE